MAASEVLLASPITWSVVASATNGNATATKTAPGAGFRHYIFGLSISLNGAPAAAISVQLRKDAGATILDQWEIPAGAIAPIIVNYLSHPFEGSDNGDMDLFIPSGGAGIKVTAVLKGTTRSAG